MEATVRLHCSSLFWIVNGFGPSTPLPHSSQFPNQLYIIIYSSYIQLEWIPPRYKTITSFPCTLYKLLNCHICFFSAMDLPPHCWQQVALMLLVLMTVGCVFNVTAHLNVGHNQDGTMLESQKSPLRSVYYNYDLDVAEHKKKKYRGKVSIKFIRCKNEGSILNYSTIRPLPWIWRRWWRWWWIERRKTVNIPPNSCAHEIESINIYILSPVYWSMFYISSAYLIVYF